MKALLVAVALSPFVLVACLGAPSESGDATEQDVDPQLAAGVGNATNVAPQGTTKPTATAPTSSGPSFGFGVQTILTTTGK